LEEEFSNKDFNVQCQKIIFNIYDQECNTLLYYQRRKCGRPHDSRGHLEWFTFTTIGFNQK